MAEFALFSLASKLLFTIASPSFKKAYEKVRSIRKARDDLDKLRSTIQTIQVILLDAEKKQESFVAVKEWVKRIRDVLYDADDLFDEVTTNDLLEQAGIEGNKLLKKVRVLISNKSIAKRVKTIRKSLLEISIDMGQFEFVRCQYEEPICGMRKGQDPGYYVDSKDVFGRDKDKKDILELLLDESNEREKMPVIVVAGIGGMGKTTLAQLVYNNEEIQKTFKKRWFACISDTSDDKEVYGKIFQAIFGESYGDLTVSQLQYRIRESIIGNGRVLLVLDDVWDEDHGRWLDRLRLLSNGATGSKIIVTTRSLSVAKAMDAIETRKLDGLSKDEAWALFKRVAFVPEQENDPRWINLGKEIVKKCSNVPLAIKSIASLLYTKPTIQEWESLKDEELSSLELQGDGSIMSALKLSYDHLPSNLKHCFAYCSLFSKGYRFKRDELIYFWIAQGYIKKSNEKQTLEEVGHSCFMDLLRRCFFQDVEEDSLGVIKYCKMHDLVHDLAQYVAGEEIIMLTMTSREFNSCARHMSCSYAITNDDSWEVLPTLLNTKRLRSLILMIEHSHCQRALDQQVTKFKFLRTLSLSSLRIHNVSSSIGKLKHLRYLDLSNNPFKSLPDSITKLLNLLTLDIKRCENLQAFPANFRRLINLRHLSIEKCNNLKHMPLGFDELTSLQHLSNFKVGKPIGDANSSCLDVVAGLNLRGTLSIEFDGGIDNWDGDDCWQLPAVSLHQLVICDYPGKRIPHWIDDKEDNLSMMLNLTYLSLTSCMRVKYLPPVRRLPYLKSLFLASLSELEYVEEEEETWSKHNSNASFFPCLSKLVLECLPKLKGWSRKVEATTNREEHSSLLLFPLLCELTIENCRELKSVPLTPRIKKLQLDEVNGEVVQQLLSTSFNLSPSPSTSSSSSLEEIAIWDCEGLTSFQGESFTSLQCLYITRCNSLKILRMAPSHLNVLEELEIWSCPNLELWEEEKMGVEWDSLPNLRKLDVDTIPDRLPDCLRRLQALERLQISQPAWGFTTQQGSDSVEDEQFI